MDQSYPYEFMYPFFARMNIAEMINRAIVRPRAKNYYDISQAIYMPLHQALRGEVTPAQALQAIQNVLKK